MARFDTRDLGSWDQDVAALAGSLVHEVKNPLSTININTQLCIEEFPHPASQREQRLVKRLGVVAEEVTRIEQIVNTFLQFTRREELQSHAVQVNEVLDELRSRVVEGMERAGIRFHYQPDESTPTIQGDRRLLYQAFLNLVVNAEQAMPEGGELILRSHCRGAVIEIEIIDTGLGISAAQLSKVFRPYFSSKMAGTGLGLPTTLRIIRAHGGNIRLESELGKGSRFVVVLPVDAPSRVARDESVEDDAGKNQ